MTTAIDICNRALSKMGARMTITALDSSSPASAACALWYDTIRMQLLRAAPWGFSRKTVMLTSLGLATDSPNIVPYPWVDMYEYPADCLKFRYVLPPPSITTTGSITPPSVGGAVFPWWGMPSRSFRYLVSQYTDATPTTVKVLLSNVVQAYGVYTSDVTDPALMDEQFIQALVSALAAELVMPLSGNVQMIPTFTQLAQGAIVAARATDGNEAIPSSDVKVDWIETRGVGPLYPGVNVNWGNYGSWYSGWDSSAWGM